MKCVKLLSACFTALFPVWAMGQIIALDCEKELLDAEQNRQETIYLQCGFDDESTAMNTWAPWAQENQAYQALYEIYTRHPHYWSSPDLFNAAIQGKNGPALVLKATELYQQKNYPEAISLYSEALRSPLLNDEEKGLITQNIGLLYLNPQSSYYNAKKGLPLIKKATQQRSALSNNIMGVYSLFGLEETTVDEKEAFFYLWRAALLGCPSAQENLGVYYLLYNKKISKQQAWEEMKDKIFSCEVSHLPENAVIQQTSAMNCDCPKIQERLNLINDAEEYKFIFKEKNQNILENKSGQRFYVQVGTVLPDGNKVQEIRKNVVILNNPKKVLYLLPSNDCIQFCKNKQKNKAEQKQKITPYHFTFSQKECSDILYYAEQLVDTKRPFVGKKECAYSDKLEIANNLLLNE